MFHQKWKKISKFMVLTFLENALNLDIFTHVPLPHSTISPKFLSSHPMQSDSSQFHKQHFFENLFSPTAEKGEENYFIRIQSENMKMTQNIRLFMFCMICNICHIIWCQFYCLSFWNHDTLILKLHQKKYSFLNGVTA